MVRPGRKLAGVRISVRQEHSGHSDDTRYQAHQAQRIAQTAFPAGSFIDGSNDCL